MSNKREFKKAFSVIIAVSFAFWLWGCTLKMYGCNFEVPDYNPPHNNKAYTIVFDANGGEGQRDNLYVEKGKTGNLPRCGFSREGYVSNGYSLTPNGYPVYNVYNGIFGGALSWLGSVKDGDTVTLYPSWSSVGFEVEEGGVGLQLVSTIRRYSGSAENVIVPAVTKCYLKSLPPLIFANHPEIKTVLIPPTISKIAINAFTGFTSEQTIIFKGKQSEWNDIKEKIQNGEQPFMDCAARLIFEE